ncbi:hypothetical protein JXB01_04630, partial [Candidatus Micrarchaeota archaeon]|nr:hypothetical protein [Candidatus Micrarchaeota archaeon]
FFGYSFYQLMAVAVQLFVGSSLIYLLTGIPLEISILLLSAIVLTYSWISGLKASISTDLIQLGFIFLGLAVIIPMVLAHSGGLNSITKGIGGITGEHTNLFDPAVAFSFGLVTSIGLIAGAIADQQFWQRTFAFDKKSIKSGFLAGALLFGLVPITLSSLGFIAAGSGMLIPQGTDPSMVGVLAVAGLLPEVFLVLFFVMLLAGLTSTLDSGLSAFSSLYSVDIKKYTLSEDLSNPRAGMIIILFAGIAVALTVNYIPAIGLKQLWWIFNAVAAALIIPTVLSLYWDKLTSKGARYGIISALIIGLPLFVYGNFIDNSVLIVVSAVLILALNLLFCWVFRKEEIKGAGRISQPNQDVS